MKLAFPLVSLCLASLCTVVLAQQEPPRPAATTLSAPKGATQSVDTRGFIHRWWVLEPVPVQGRLTETAVQEALKLAALPDAATPAQGGRVTVEWTESRGDEAQGGARVVREGTLR